MRTSFNDSRGATIIEGLTVIGIMMVVLMIVNQIFVSGYGLFVKQSARTDVENGVVLAARAIAETTRGATEVEVSSVINGTTYTTGTNVLVLKVPSIDSSDNVIAANYDHIAVYRDATDTTAIKTDTQISGASQRPSGKKIITKYNSILAFRYNDPTPADATRVQVYLRNALTTRSTTVTAKAWTAIFLRNK